MTARKYCAATADDNLLSLPDLPCLKPNVAPQPVYQPAFTSRKHGETNFLFLFSRLASIDAILLTGIAFRQIR
jgi:hypothetical protein